MRVGIFELVDPPEGMVETITATVNAIAFPWEKVQPYLDREGIDAIQIKWELPSWMSNQTTGNWYAADNTIYLGTQFSGWQENVPFVLTHEIGHFVDRAYLTDKQRTALMAVFHDHPDWSVPPQVTHDSDLMHHEEWWGNGGAPYPAKIYECFADEFVATFAPTVWDGSVTEAAPQHFPRFVHWSDDFEAVRRIVLAAPAPKPKPRPRPKPPAKAPHHRPQRRWLCRWWRSHFSSR